MPVTKNVSVTVHQVFQFDLMAPGVSEPENGKSYTLVFYALPNITFKSIELGVSAEALEREALKAACQLAADLCEIDVAVFTDAHYVYPGPYIVVETKSHIDRDVVMRNWRELPKTSSLW